ncbi:hypothetical protein ACFLSA_06305, partial [Bacteroidota bacterium]
LDREMIEFKQLENPPYYIDYRVEDNTITKIASSFGSLSSSHTQKNRSLTVSVRIGDYDFDNTHMIENEMYKDYNESVVNSNLPLNYDAPEAIRQIIWLSTDQAYKKALSSYISLMNSKEELNGNSVSDFSKVEPQVYIEPKPLNWDILNIKKAEKQVKKYTAIFQEDTSVVYANANYNYLTKRKYYINTEGTNIVQNFSYCHLSISVNVKSDENYLLPYTKSYYAFTPEDLPDHDSIMRDLMEAKELLVQIIHAKDAEPYTGPALLSPEATGKSQKTD